MDTLLFLAIPAFVVLLVAEVFAVRGRAVKGYEVRDTWTSLGLGVANVIISGSLKAGVFGLYLWLYQFRWFDLPNAWWVWGLLFFAEDLCYYAFHRAGHEVRFFWAAHVNHHSSRYFNFSTALRQSWTTPLTGPVFWLGLPLLGFHPAMIAIVQAISLIYQFWLHTELIGRLGPFEWLFNTPSHHRVHHGRNVEYLDRNYGGVLILWDRLFGSFEPEAAPVDYGLTKNIETFHPLKVAFHEWMALARDVFAARSWRERLSHLLQPPGWSPDGSTHTARQLRAEAVRAGWPRRSAAA
jgi:sterol desaturase/sphingolipid hydroxylase (fatty acid hydroxylase superfamily)